MKWLICGLWVLLMPVWVGAGNPAVELFYEQPAQKWDEAVPLGNGRLGAMVFGTVPREHVQLNEDTLWTGGPHNYNRKAVSKYLPQIRALLREGKYEEACRLGDKHMIGSPANIQAYQPFGDLFLEFAGQELFEDYRRSLNMSSGVASLSYRSGGVQYSREVFTSFPDQVMVMRLSCDRPGKLSFATQLSSPHPSQCTTQNKNTAILSGQVAAHEAAALLGEWKKPGTRFEARVQVLDTDGTVSTENGAVSVSDAQYATLLYAAATAYVNYKDVSGDPASTCRDTLAAASRFNCDQLRQRHVEDHRRLFDRVQLDLGAAKSMPTDKRIAAVRAGAADPALEALAFQFGRYLLMASSRPGSQPANLQGIWNDKLRPAWGSKWTLNINAPMNYWPVETCNLSECHEPLLQLLEDLREPGRETAREYYDCGGFVVHHNTDLWRASAIVDSCYFGAWPMGAAWLSHHLWEHYDFTGDKAFLEKAYPTMKEAAEFFIDFLIKDENGYWVTSPALSFEQGFLMKDGSQGRLCIGPTEHMQILRAFFADCIEASRILNRDEEFRNSLSAIRDQLAPTMVNPESGRLQEWRDGREPAHTYDGQLGHLWGLCPGDEITPFKTPDLAAGAEKSMRHRGFRLGSWTSGKTLNYWARLHNCAEYGKALNAHMRGHVLPNMMSSFDGGLFQIDGNLGMTASVAEALLQSHAGEIHLLPALPPFWTEGSVRGLCARGGFEFDLTWSNGELKQVLLRSKSGGRCTIRYRKFSCSIDAAAGSTHKLNGMLKTMH